MVANINNEWGYPESIAIKTIDNLNVVLPYQYEEVYFLRSNISSHSYSQKITWAIAEKQES